MNLLRRIHTSLHRRVWIMSKDVTLRSSTNEPTDIRPCFLDQALLDAYSALRPGLREQAIRRLREGQRAVMVFDGDKAVGATWVATGRAYIPYLDRDILLRPDEIYAYDAFTAPEYRRRGIAVVRSDFIDREYTPMGFVRSAAIVAFENRAGLRSAEATGYVRRGVFACIRLGFTQVDLPDPNQDLPRFVRPLKRPHD